jgi:multiple sugar transport system substrate-binding protein
MKRFMLILVLIAMLIVPAGAFAQDGPKKINMWRHISDLQRELDSYREIVQSFNESQDEYEIVWEELPQESYADSISAAALAGELPCIIDVDGPFIPNFAWAGNIIPLDEYISDELKEDLISSVIGTYKGEIYGLGMFDAGVAIYARKSVLEDNDIRIPTLEEPWTLEEFNATLEKLAALEEFDLGIDLLTNYNSDGYITYIYSPILQSFGGDLINRENYVEAEGILNGPEAIAFGEWMQWLFDEGLADPASPDDQAFITGVAPLAYTGSWYYADMSEAWEDDLLLLPVPDYGTGPVVGGASWQWSITSACEYPEGAWQFFEHMFKPENVAKISDATGNMPGRKSAAPMTERYTEDSPLTIFLEQKEWTVMRPETPAFLTISSAFGEAMRDIWAGGDVQDALDDAVDTIELDILDNDGYGFEIPEEE